MKKEIKMKSNEALYKAIGEIKEEYLPNINKAKRAASKRAVIGWLTAAAVVLGIFAAQVVSLINAPVKEIEIFPASCYDPENTFMGTEKIPFQDKIYGIWAYPTTAYIDLNNYVDNPWNEETAPDILPVFKYLLYRESGGYHLNRYFTEEQLRDIAEKAAEALGVSITKTDAVYDREWYYFPLEYSMAEYFREKNIPMYFKAECDGEMYGKEAFTITASNRSISLEFSDMYYDSYVNYEMDPLELPDNGDISVNAPTEKVLRTVQELIDSFNGLIQYKNPKIITWLSIYNNKQSGIHVFDMTDNDILNILNYNFSYTAFEVDEDTNSVNSINLYNLLPVTEYLGDYSVISPKEVKEMLINDGYYVYTEDHDIIKCDKTVKAEDIKKIEMVYAGFANPGYFIPYYRIYIEAQDAEKNEEPGYKQYQILYYPAINEEYFDFPVSEEPAKIELNEEILYAIPDDLVKFPNGSYRSKKDAIATGGTTETPELKFDFAVVRFAEAEYRSTLDDPDCYDFETGKGKDDFGIGFSRSKWFMMEEGDVITGDMSVKSAETYVTWYGGTQKISKSSVEFDGTMSIEGIFYYPNDENAENAVMFFPTPKNAWKMPIIYTPHRRCGWFVTEDEEAIFTDSEEIWINFDVLPDCFKEKQTVKVKAVLKDIVLSYSETAQAFYADLESYEILE